MTLHGQSGYRNLVRACAMALLALLLAPFLQGISAFAGPEAGGSAACNCPCCHGKHTDNCACSRRAHAAQRNAGKPQLAEFSSRCSCPLALPACFHNKNYAPSVQAANLLYSVSLLRATSRRSAARISRRWTANLRRGPPAIESICCSCSTSTRSRSAVATRPGESHA